MAELDLNRILAQFQRRSWPAILKALYKAGFIDKEEALSALARVSKFATEFSVLAETTLHDQALSTLDVAEAAGMTFDEFKAEAHLRLASRLAGPRPAMGETIVHADLQIPYNESRRRETKESEPKGFYRFTAVLDNRTTEICESLDGTTLPMNDPFWDEHSPPLHSDCRSQLVEYDPGMAGKIGITSRPERGEYVPPEDGWGGSEFSYDKVLAGKNHVLEAIAREKIRNPLW